MRRVNPLAARGALLPPAAGHCAIGRAATGSPAAVGALPPSAPRSSLASPRSPARTPLPAHA
eukprot:489568-Pleurochrysis_carterae.AAC.1